METLDIQNLKPAAGIKAKSASRRRLENERRAVHAAFGYADSDVAWMTSMRGPESSRAATLTMVDDSPTIVHFEQGSDEVFVRTADSHTDPRSMFRGFPRMSEGDFVEDFCDLLLLGAHSSLLPEVSRHSAYVLQRDPSKYFTLANLIKDAVHTTPYGREERRFRLGSLKHEHPLYREIKEVASARRGVKVAAHRLSDIRAYGMQYTLTSEDPARRSKVVVKVWQLLARLRPPIWTMLVQSEDGEQLSWSEDRNSRGLFYFRDELLVACRAAFS